MRVNSLLQTVCWYFFNIFAKFGDKVIQGLFKCSRIFATLREKRLAFNVHFWQTMLFFDRRQGHILFNHVQKQSLIGKVFIYINFFCGYIQLKHQFSMNRILGEGVSYITTGAFNIDCFVGKYFQYLVSTQSMYFWCYDFDCYQFESYKLLNNFYFLIQ